MGDRSHDLTHIPEGALGTDCSLGKDSRKEVREAFQRGESPCPKLGLIRDLEPRGSWGWCQVQGLDGDGF